MTPRLSTYNRDTALMLVDLGRPGEALGLLYAHLVFESYARFAAVRLR